MARLYGYLLCMVQYFELFTLFSEIFLISIKRLEYLHIPLSGTDLEKLILGFPVLVSDGLGSFWKLCSEIIQENTVPQPLDINTVDRTVFQRQNWIKMQRSNLYEFGVLLLNFSSRCICDVKLKYISIYSFHNWSRTASPFFSIISLVLSLKLQLC